MKNYDEGGTVARLISESEQGYGKSAQDVTKIFIKEARVGKGVHDNNLLNFVADVLERALDNARWRACITNGGQMRNPEIDTTIGVGKAFGASNAGIDKMLDEGSGYTKDRLKNRKKARVRKKDKK